MWLFKDLFEWKEFAIFEAKYSVKLKDMENDCNRALRQG